MEISTDSANIVSGADPVAMARCVYWGARLAHSLVPEGSYCELGRSLRATQAIDMHGLATLAT